MPTWPQPSSPLWTTQCTKNVSPIERNLPLLQWNAQQRRPRSSTLLSQCVWQYFSTFVRLRPGKFFFTRRGPGPNRFNRQYFSNFFFFCSYIKLTYSMVQCPSWEANCLQLVKKFPTFHGTRRFITALTSVRHLSLTWTSPIQSIYPHPTSWRSSLILPTHLRLGLPSGLLPYGFPTKTLYTPSPHPYAPH